MTNQEIIQKIIASGVTSINGKQVRREVFDNQIQLWEIKEACEWGQAQGILSDPYQSPDGEWKVLQVPVQEEQKVMTEDEIKTAIREIVMGMATDETFTPAQVVPSGIPNENTGIVRGIRTQEASKICRSLHVSTYGRQRPMKGRYLFCTKSGKQYWWDTAS